MGMKDKNRAFIPKIGCKIIGYHIKIVFWGIEKTKTKNIPKNVMDYGHKTHNFLLYTQKSCL